MSLNMITWLSKNDSLIFFSLERSYAFKIQIMILCWPMLYFSFSGYIYFYCTVFESILCYLIYLLIDDFFFFHQHFFTRWRGLQSVLWPASQFGHSSAWRNCWMEEVLWAPIPVANVLSKRVAFVFNVIIRLLFSTSYKIDRLWFGYAATYIIQLTCLATYFLYF